MILPTDTLTIIEKNACADCNLQQKPFSQELNVDSKSIFNGESHVRYVQASSSDLIAYDVLAGMTPQPFIGLSGSQTGVVYEICEDGKPTGLSMEGTGLPIEFENVPTGAIFTVRGAKTGLLFGGKPVMREMNGKAVLLVKPEQTITPYANAIITKTYPDYEIYYADITYYDEQRTEGVRDHSAYIDNVFDKSGQDRIRYSYRPGDIYRSENKFTELRYETNSLSDSVSNFQYDT